MKKKCYICLPIGGQEDTAITRANEAAKFVKEYLGYEPITPMEINDETQDVLNNPDRPVGEFMGNDIRVLIEDCDAIYVCKGWERSKGCNVELECASQWGKTIFYEEIPLNNGFIEVVINRFDKLVQEYKSACKLWGDVSFQSNILAGKIEDYKDFMKKWFSFEI